MTTPELITDEIVRKFHDAFYADVLLRRNTMKSIKAAILAIQDDITRPWINLMRGEKQEREAYERALKIIRANKSIDAQEIADAALKGNYHKTDFTEFGKQDIFTHQTYKGSKGIEVEHTDINKAVFCELNPITKE